MVLSIELRFSITELCPIYHSLSLSLYLSISLTVCIAAAVGTSTTFTDRYYKWVIREQALSAAALNISLTQISGLENDSDIDEALLGDYTWEEVYLWQELAYTESEQSVVSISESESVGKESSCCSESDEEEISWDSFSQTYSYSQSEVSDSFLVLESESESSAFKLHTI